MAKRATESKATLSTAASAEAPTLTQEELITRLREHLVFLRLGHTNKNLEEVLAWARRERRSPTEVIEHVLGAEVASKRDARIERRINSSGMRERKLLEVFDWDFQPALDRGTVIELSRLDFVERAEDVVINGNPGTGKSHILKAIGLRACERGISIRYARCVDLIDDLHAGLADGTYPKRLRSWVRPRLLMIDDVGLGQLKCCYRALYSRGFRPCQMMATLTDRRVAECQEQVGQEQVGRPKTARPPEGLTPPSRLARPPTDSHSLRPPYPRRTDAERQGARRTVVPSLARTKPARAHEAHPLVLPARAPIGGRPPRQRRPNPHALALAAWRASGWITIPPQIDTCAPLRVDLSGRRSGSLLGLVMK